MKCSNCGSELKENEKFCTKCGTKVEVQQEAQPKKSNTGLIIGLVLGGLVLFIIIIIAIVVAFFLLIPKNSTKEGDRTTTQNVTTAKPFDGDDKKEDKKNLDFTNVSFKAEDDNERSKNIELVKANMGKSSLTPVAYVAIKNNNSEHVDISIYVNYYKDGQRLGSDMGTMSFIKPGTIATSSIYLSNKDEYDSFDITYKTSKPGTYMKDVEVNDSNFKKKEDNEKQSYGTFTNTSKHKVYGYGTCIRYKGNDIVFVENGYLGYVEAGKTGECTCHKITVPDNIEYDKTECSLYNVYYTEGE